MQDTALKMVVSNRRFGTQRLQLLPAVQGLALLPELKLLGPAGRG